MNLIINQFRTDWRHFRLLLLGLWGLFAAQLLPECSFFDGNDPAGIQMLIILFQIGLGAHVLARVVQSDSLVGDSAQWLTRPIRRGHLLGAKTAFIAICIILPRFIPQMVIWRWHHYTFDLTLASFGGVLLFSVAFVLFFCALAALTQNESRFFLLLGVVLGVVFAWMAMLSIAASHGNGPAYSTARMASGFTAGFLFLSGCTLFTWIWQALSGRGLPGKIALALGLLALPWLLMRWPYSFLAARDLPHRPLAISPLGEAKSLEDSPDGQILWSQFLITGLAPHTIVVAENAGDWATFTVNGQRQAERLPPARYAGMRVLPMQSSQEAAYLAAIHDFFPPDTLWGGHSARNWSGFPFLDPMLKKYTNRPEIGTFQAELELDQFKVVLAERLPLKAGAWDVAPGKRVVINWVSPRPNGVEVEIEERMATPMLSRQRYLVLPTMGAQSFCTYVLYQPDGGEADVLEGNSYSGQSGFLNQEASGTIRLLLPYPALQERLAGGTREDFLAKATLCIFVPEYQGTAHQILVQTNFNLSAVNSESPAASDDLKKIDSIGQAVLPGSPTVAQLNEYLDAILGHLPDQSAKPLRDRIQRRLEAIGSPGLPVLLARLPLDSRLEQEYVFPLLTKLATREQLPELRSALGRDMELAEWFHNMNWDADARDLLVGKLGDHRVHFSATALTIAAGAQDPATYADLAWHFVRLDYGQGEVAEALAKCPGFDLPAAVREAWARVQLHLISSGDLALSAARQGLPGAFDQAVIELENDRKSALENQYRALQITALTDFSGSPDTALNWLSANLGHFQYDSATRRYLIAAQSSAQ